MGNRRFPGSLAAGWVLLGALGLAGTAGADEQWDRAMKGARDALNGGELSEARRWLDSANRRVRTFGDNDWRRAGTTELGGAIALVRGDLDAAGTALADAANTWRALFGDQSAPLLSNQVAGGRLALARGDVDAARAAFESAVRDANTDTEAGRAAVADAWLGLADVALATGSPDHERHLEEAAGAAEGLPRATAEVALARAAAAARLGDLTAARDQVSAARAAATNAPGAAFLTASADYLDGLLSLAGSTASRAVSELGSAVQGWEDGGVRDHPALARALAALARAQWQAGNTREADAAMQRAVTMAPRAVEGGHPLRSEIALAAAAHAARAGDSAAALRLARPLLAASLPAVTRARVASLVAVAAAGQEDTSAAAEATAALDGIKTGAIPALDAATVDDARAVALLARGDERAALDATLNGVGALEAGSPHPLLARLRLRAATLHLSLGDTAAASAQAAAALDSALAGPPSALTTEALLSAARVADLEGRPADAEQRLGEALTAAEAAAGGTSVLHATVQRQASLRSMHAGAATEALGQAAAALSTAQKALPARHPDLLPFWLAQLDTQIAAGRIRDAAASLRSATPLASRADAATRVAFARRTAAIELAQNRVDESFKRLGAALETAGALPPGARRDRLTFETAADLADLERHRGDAAAALAALPADRPAAADLAERWGYLSALAALEAGQPAVAEARLDAAMSVLEAGTPAADRLLGLRATLLERSAQPEQALDLRRQAVDAAVSAFGENHQRVAAARLGQARAERGVGRYADAQATLTRVGTFLADSGLAEEAAAVPWLVERATLATELADTAAADEALATAQRALEKSVRPEHPALASLTLSRIALQVDAGNASEAQTQLGRFNAQVGRRLPPAHPVRIRSVLLGARLALSRGQLSSARTEIDKVLKALPADSPADPRRLDATEMVAEVALAAGDTPAVLAALAGLPENGSLSRSTLLARARLAAGDAASAIEGLTRALDGLGSGAQRLDAVAVQALLADAQAAAGDVTSAEATLRDARSTVGAADDAHPLGVTLDTRLAAILLDAGRVAEALTVAETAQRNARDRLGDEHPAYAAATAATGRALVDGGRLSDGVTALKLAHALEERTLGAGHPRTATTAGHLVDVLTTAGELGEASTLLARTLAAVGRLNGGTAPAALADRFGLQQGWLRLAQGQPAAAREAFEARLGTESPAVRAEAAAGAALSALRLRDLDAVDKALGALPDDLSTRATWLAGAVAATRRSLADPALSPETELRAVADRAIAARGPDHPEVIALSCTLGELAATAGHSDVATQWLEQCRDGAASVLAPSHPLVESAAVQLVHERLRAGDLDGAEADLGAVEQSEASGDAARAARGVARASLQRARGEAGAIETLEGAVAASERALGPRHPTHAQRVVRLGAALTDADRAVESEPMLRRALSALEQALGKTHPALSGVLGELGRANLALGRTSGAMTYLRRQSELVERAHGPDDVRLVAPLTLLADLQMRAGQTDAGLAGLARAHGISVALDAASVGTADAASRLADSLVSAGRHEDALGHYQAALGTYDTQLDPADARITRTLRSLAAISLMMGKTDAAADFLARAGSRS